MVPKRYTKCNEVVHATAQIRLIPVLFKISYGRLLMADQSTEVLEVISAEEAAEFVKRLVNDGFTEIIVRNIDAGVTVRIVAQVALKPNTLMRT